MKKILLAEDDSFLQTLYSDLLKEAKFDLTICKDGEEAYNHIKSGGWDLVILDVMLPKMTGVDVVRKLKDESPKSLKQKIIFMSNADDEATLKDIKETGLEHILKSDMNPDQFVAKVRALLTE